MLARVSFDIRAWRPESVSTPDGDAPSGEDRPLDFTVTLR
jgi:hypothetical protein